MDRLPAWLTAISRQQSKRLLAIIIVAGLFLLAQTPALSAANKRRFWIGFPFSACPCPSCRWLRPDTSEL